MAKMRALQPQYFERFGCIGADCEDTCCDGWGVIIDRATYEKYQDPRIGPIAAGSLSDLVEINPSGSSSSDYARIRMAGTRCPAFHEGLCSIQQTLGESYISDMCSSFPRALSVVGGVVETSLHLSCPEAARLVLTDPDAMTLHERAEVDLSFRPGSISLIGDAPDVPIRQVRDGMSRIIKDRSRPLWQRIVSLGFAIDELARDRGRAPGAILEDQLQALRHGRLDAMAGSRAPAPAAQLETVLELIVARIGAEFTSPRFLECYGEFMRGLAWTGETTMEDLAGRYRQALQCHFLPFVRRHEHLFENYLLNYMFRTLFPYGRKQPDLKVAIDTDGNSMRSAYLLLAAHYAIIRTVLIGMSGLHQDRLDIQHAVKVVQSCSKTFQHSSSFSTVALQYLAPYGENPTQTVAMLVMD